MAGMGGLEVGRVHIRVVPDFTHFRKEMVEELAFWEKRKITIKVDADRSGLAGLSDDLSKTAKRSSKAMSAELAKGVNGVGKDIELNPKLTGNRARLVRRLRSDLERVLSKMEVNLKLAGFDDAAARLTLDREEKRIQKLLGAITPELDSTDFLSQASQLERVLNDLKRRAVEIPVRYQFEDSLAKWLAAEKEFVRKVKESHKNLDNARVSSGADLQVGLNKIREQREEMQQLTRAAGDARLAIERAFLGANDKSGSAALREYVYGFRDLDGQTTRLADRADRLRLRGGLLGALVGGASALGAINLAKDSVVGVGKAAAAAGQQVTGMASKIADIGGKLKPSFGTGINLGGYAVILVGALALAAPVIGLLTTALLTLPGILATIIAPITAITLGFKGIQKAAENAGLFRDKNGDKKGGGSLGEALTELQKKTEDVFENTLTEPFKRFGSLSKELIAPMETVAQGAADIMGGMVDSINENIENGRIGETMQAIGTELSRSFAPGLQDMSDALIGLAHEFTTGGALEGLGNWFRDTMADFENWVNTTDLTTEFEGLGGVLKDILDSLGQMASKGLEFMNDPAAVQNFRDNLTRIYDLLEGIVSLSESIQGAFANIIPDFDPGKAWVEDIFAPFTSKDAPWRDMFPSVSEMFPPPADFAAAGLNFSKSITEGFDAGLALGSPLQGLNEASQEELNRLAYGIAQAGTQGVEQLNQAITAGGVETGVAQQIQAKVGAAVTGSLQALEPLKAGLQTEIDGALAPLGDLAGRIDSAFGGVAGKVQGALSQIPGVVSSSLGSLGAIAGLAMAPVAQEVQKGCDAALLAATFGAPKIIGPFQELSGQMSGLGADMMAGLGQGISANVGIAKAAAETAAAEVLAAAKRAVRSKSPSKDFMDLGKDTQTGLAIGINNASAGPISAIKEVMLAIKEVFGSAEGLNLNFFMGQAATSMSDMATSSKEFRTNMVEAGTSPAVTSGLDASTTDLTDIKRQKAELDVRIAELQAQKNATTDKAAKAGLTAEIDQLRIQKERLDLLKEETGLQEDRKTAIQQLSDQIATNITDMIKMPGEFAKTTANAAMQDIGISGSGAIPTIANWAMDAGTNFIFNVNNMDDAIQGQQAQQSKQVAGTVSR